MLFKIAYKIYYAFIWLITAPPLWLLFRISDVLYILTFHLIKYRKKTVFKNLRNAFPEKPETEIENIARKFYKHLCDFFVESSKSIHFSKQKMDKHFRYLNPEIFEPLYTQNKHVVLVSGHYANWEWMIYFPHFVKHAFLVIYRPLRNKFTDKFIHDSRSHAGAQLTPQKEIFRKIIEYKKQNIPTVTWFLADQRPPKSNTFWTTFLNQDTSFYLGGEKIAQKLNAAVVFMDIRKVKRGHYEIYFDLLFDDVSACKDHEITHAYIKKLEDVIKQKPAFWLWSHKRWKHKKPMEASE